MLINYHNKTDISKNSVTTKKSFGKAQKSTMKIDITINSQTFSAHLNNSVASSELANRLPLTLSFRNFASGFHEKIGDLKSPLTIKGMSDADNPKPGDIGYWSPQPRIVLYWGDVSAYSGIHVIGSFDDRSSAINYIRRQSDPFKVVISRQ